MELEKMLQLFIQNHVLIKLCFAAIAGLVIGFERELKGKPLGLKTCLLISVTSCLLTIVSFEAAFLYSEAYSRPMDPGRIPSYIISGIGFLGAGVILRRSNEAISGLTTAALVLASAAIGISLGMGFYLEAMTGVIFIIFGLQVIPFLVESVGPKKLREKEIKVKLVIQKKTDLTSLMKGIKGKKLGIKKVRVKEEAQDIVIYCYVVTNEHRYTTDVFYDLKTLTGVLQVEVENLK